MSDITAIKNLVEEQGKAHAAFEETLKNDLKKRDESLERMQAENSEAFEKIDKQLEDYENFKERADELHAQGEREKLAGDIEAQNKAELEQFKNYLRMGDRAFSNATAMEVRSDPDGGYTVPTPLSQRIITTSEGNNPMAQLAARESLGVGNSMDILVDPDELGYSESTEGSAASDTTTPEIFKTNIPLKKIDAEPKATIELLQDSSWDIEAYLERKAGRIFRKRLNTQLTTGDGVDQVRGLMTYTAVANATFEADVPGNWNSVGYIASGNASTLPDADSLIDITGSVEDIYLPNASFQMKRSTLNVVRKLKATVSTAGDKLYTLWTPSLVPGQPDTLMGYPVYKNDAMAAIAANALSIAFGDIEEAYTIVDKVGGMYMVRDPFTNKAYVKFYFARRMGGGIVNFEAVKYLKIASS
jgi:HK97 family phage major capsid protein